MPSNPRYINSIVTTARKGRPTLPWERKRRDALAASAAMPLPPRTPGVAPAAIAAAV